MATVSQIYAKYGIPGGLRMHMLRATAVGKLICDHWRGEDIGERTLTRVLLLHDLGNIVKIDSNSLGEKDFASGGSLELFETVRDRFLQRFGLDDHKISEAIGEEIGLTTDELDLMARKVFVRNDETLASDNFTLKIGAYADQRVAPNGIVGLLERLLEAKERYSNKPGSSMNNPRTDMLIHCAEQIEAQIMSRCTLKASEITDDRAHPVIHQLESYGF